MAYRFLDVGCGNATSAKGDVNVDFFREGQNLQMGEQLIGEPVNPHGIENFVVADACHLPFKDSSFNVVYSSHTIEHMKDPSVMFNEMHRVANRKVIIRCPHREGSGANRPFHLSYLDETWFRLSAFRLGYASRQFTTILDYPISNRFQVSAKWKKNLFWRALRHIERRWLIRRFNIPFELESWTHISENRLPQCPVRFVVVFNDEKILHSSFMKGVIGDGCIYSNQDGTAIPEYFNHYLSNLDIDAWIVFCHQDFFLKESLEPILATLDADNVYGVIGARFGFSKLFGRVMQTDDTFTGVSLEKPEPVQTLDEMCLIVHSSLFHKGLRFDPQFKFHFYGADLCMDAYTKGFGVYALQVNCQHKSKALSGNITSPEFIASKKLFAEKWRKFLPIRTTTMVVEA